MLRFKRLSRTGISLSGKKMPCLGIVYIYMRPFLEYSCVELFLCQIRSIHGHTWKYISGCF